MSTIKILAITSALVATSTLAWAVSPHFVGKVTASSSGTTVQVCWKEAGVGANQNIDYTASANATATYVCKTNAGTCPNAANKTTVNGPVSSSGTSSSDRNGNITGCLSLNAPGAGSFTCPKGQTLTLSSVSFTGIKIEDTTNDVGQTATPSSLSTTPFTCP